MARSVNHSRDYGAWLLALSTTAGLCLSLFNDLSRASGIAGTGGALLVVVSSALVLGASLLMALDRVRGTALRAFHDVSTLLGVLGTGLAAYFLEAYVLVAFMALGLLGWSMHMVLGPPEPGPLSAAGAVR